MLNKRDEKPHSVGGAWENLKRAAPKEAAAFHDAETNARKELTSLKKEAPEEYDTWWTLKRAMAVEMWMDFEDRAEIYEAALKEAAAELQKAAPGEWLAYLQLVEEKNEAEAELAKASPVKWAWWRSRVARESRRLSTGGVTG